MDANTVTQLALKERLQTKWLEVMEQRLMDGTINATELATLARVLMANGWTLDPTAIPQGLQSALTSNVAFDEDATEPHLRIAR